MNNKENRVNHIITRITALSFSFYQYKTAPKLILPGWFLLVKPG
jgi:hypothetical protein